jgi:hypothetical protein
MISMRGGFGRPAFHPNFNFEKRPAIAPGA